MNYIIDWKYPTTKNNLIHNTAHQWWVHCWHTYGTIIVLYHHDHNEEKNGLGTTRINQNTDCVFHLVCIYWGSHMDLLRGSTIFRNGISWINNAKTGLKINRLSIVNSGYTTTNTLLNPFQQWQNKVITFY